MKVWMGDLPETCDVCNRKIDATFVDGKTQQGPWGILCLRCHKVHGCGLGTGKGQRYVLSGDRFVKEEG